MGLNGGQNGGMRGGNLFAFGARGLGSGDATPASPRQRRQKPKPNHSRFAGVAREIDEIVALEMANREGGGGQGGGGGSHQLIFSFNVEEALTAQSADTFDEALLKVCNGM